MTKPIKIDPEHPTRLQDLIEDLQGLDDADRETVMLAIDLVYRSGFAVGLQKLNFLEVEQRVDNLKNKGYYIGGRTKSHTP